MVEYEKLYNEVKAKMSERRFAHSEHVVKRAVEYAEIYNIDINTVKLTAIAHDIAKELTNEEIQECTKKYNIKFDEIEQKNKSLIHAKIGYYICKDKYGFTEEMANAIKYHTTGRKNMTTLEKIIYLADATEETRQYCSRYADLIKKDIDKGSIEVCKFTISKLLEENKIIHEDSMRCYNYYIEENK